MSLNDIFKEAVTPLAGPEMRAGQEEIKLRANGGLSLGWKRHCHHTAAYALQRLIPHT